MFKRSVDRINPLKYLGKKWVEILRAEYMGACVAEVPSKKKIGWCKSRMTKRVRQGDWLTAELSNCNWLVAS